MDAGYYTVERVACGMDVRDDEILSQALTASRPFIKEKTPMVKDAPNVRWPTLIAVLGLVVTLSGGAMTWYATYRSTQQAASESCIRRVDAQETLIREKAELLLASIAAMGSKSQAPHMTLEGFHLLGQDVLDSAMRFTAYAPGELAAQTFKLARVIQLGLMARTPEEKLASIDQASTAMSGWPKAYFALMERYSERRAACLR
ncbi:hypothetical protein G7007_04520 [Pseudomonas entomophila]|jgi:hypothetical protein|uniref:hypothetical protein n=1 Tax=Pseudomonas entomophila TaxID=312306 RepID=UPI0015E45BAA|nr:hypothetical protein [Pseudomonas entomophila]MBA1192129.1 hypothetical protein [Pseudomonas entomophila]